MLKNNRGFNLIEVMLAVAILTLLATLGFYRYGDYRERAIEAQGRTLLSELFAKERVFNTHYQQFFGDWRNIGFEVRGDLYGRVGFDDSNAASNPSAPTNYNGPGAAAGAIAVRTNSDASLGCTGGICQELVESYCTFGTGQGCDWATNTFTGCFSFGIENRTQKKILKINEGKNFTVATESGCP